MQINHWLRITLFVTILLSPSIMKAQTAACKDTAEHRRLAETMWELAKYNDPDKVYAAAQAFQKHADEEGDLEGHYNAWMCGVAYNLDRVNIHDAYHIAVALKNDLKNETGGEEEQYLGPCMMGQVYNICGNIPAAIKEFEEAISLIKGTRYEKTTLYSLYMGLAHLTLSSDPDQSLHWIEEEIKILNQHKDWPVYNKAIAAAYAIKAIIYFKKKDYDTFRDWYEQALSVNQGRTDGYTGVFMSYANIYKKAVDGHLDEALAAADSVQSVKERYNIKCNLYLYAGDKDQAFNTQREWMLLNDSVTGAMMAENIQQSEQEIRIMRDQQKTTRLAIIILIISIVLAVLFIVLMFISIRSRRRYNQQLKEKNEELRTAYQKVTVADKMKGEFIRNVSHEIRTPLNIINGFSEVLTNEEYTFEPLERHGIAVAISQNTHKITSLVNKMLALANDSSRDLLKDVEETNAVSICQQALSNMPETDSDKVKIVFIDQTDGDAMLTTNSDSLLQMLSYILENAVKFTEQGHITLMVKNGEKDGKRQMQFFVEDTGCGIPADKIDKIFERFMKVDEFKEGLGLGLAYCYETATKLGGSLVLDHTSDQGTSFLLSLPKTLE